MGNYLPSIVTPIWNKFMWMDGASREIVEEMNKESDCLDAGEHSHLWVTGYIDYW